MSDTSDDYSSPPSSPSPSGVPCTSESDERRSVSGFIRKIFGMVSDPQTSDIVSWEPAGDSFAVRNERSFQCEIMKKYFRHQNFSSFVRQLNFYGFHKRSNAAGLTTFHHQHFKRGRIDLLPLIQRKSTEQSSSFKEEVTALKSELTVLQGQYDDLFKLQQKILYVFSRFLSPSAAGQSNARGLLDSSSQVGDRSGQRKRIRLALTEDSNPVQQMIQQIQNGSEILNSSTRKVRELTPVNRTKGTKMLASINLFELSESKLANLLNSADSAAHLNQLLDRSFNLESFNATNIRSSNPRKRTAALVEYKPKSNPESSVLIEEEPLGGWEDEEIGNLQANNMENQNNWITSASGISNETIEFPHIDEAETPAIKATSNDSSYPAVDYLLQSGREPFEHQEFVRLEREAHERRMRRNAQAYFHDEASHANNAHNFNSTDLLSEFPSELTALSLPISPSLLPLGVSSPPSELILPDFSSLPSPIPHFPPELLDFPSADFSNQSQNSLVPS